MEKATEKQQRYIYWLIRKSGKVPTADDKEFIESTDKFSASERIVELNQQVAMGKF